MTSKTDIHLEGCLKDKILDMDTNFQGIKDRLGVGRGLSVALKGQLGRPPNDGGITSVQYSYVDTLIQYLISFCKML